MVQSMGRSFYPKWKGETLRPCTDEQISSAIKQVYGKAPEESCISTTAVETVPPVSMETLGAAGGEAIGAESSNIDPKWMTNRYAVLEAELLYSVAFISLTFTAVKLLIHFLKEREFYYEDGNRIYKDGPYALPMAKANIVLGISDRSYSRGMDELEEKGFIKKVREGSQLRENGRWSLYMMSNDYKSWVAIDGHSGSQG